MNNTPDFLRDYDSSRGRSRKRSGNKKPFRGVLLALLLCIVLMLAVLFSFNILSLDRITGIFSGGISGIFNASVYDQESDPALSGNGAGTDIYADTDAGANAAGDFDSSSIDSATDSALSGSSAAASNGSDGAASGKYSELLSDPELMESENCYPLSDGDDGVITLRFAGDLLLDGSYAVAAYQRELSGGYLIAENAFDSDLLDLMRGADIFMLNNEFPYTSRGEPTPEKQFTFRALPSDVSFLTDIGTDIVTLANNHVYDYGEISLLDTMDTLKNAGIPYAGAGHDFEEASSPVYFVNDDVRIAIIASTQIERMPDPDTKGASDGTPGVFRSMDLDGLIAAIKEAKENSDYVIVFTHWGTEGALEPDWSQDEQAPLIAEAGADLIIGAHPHVLQKIEWQGDTPVFYSLGNYLFNSKTLDTCIAEVNLDSESGELISLRFIPALQSGCRTVSLDGDEYAAALDRMRALSPDVTIDDEGYITR